jgi:D-amino-acid dehydrogenase
VPGTAIANFTTLASCIASAGFFLKRLSKNRIQHYSKESQSMHICILGAGVIGITSAYRLLQEGHQVTLVDTLPTPGSGTSEGNGGQLSYSYVAPLADASIWRKWPYFLFSPNSPLTLRPRFDGAQWRWLLRFLQACTQSRAEATTVELLRLAFFSRDQLADLRTEIPFEFFHRTAGKLVLLGDAEMVRSAKKQVEFQARYGCNQQVVDVERCVEIEPALATSRREWVGGVYTGSEEVGDCAVFCRHMVEAMRKKAGFRFAASARASEVKVENSILRSVKAGRETLHADAFVLAMGAESAAFSRQAGFRLPVYPLKGYSITVPLKNGAAKAAPHVSITDLSQKIVYARLGDRLRVAGRLEIVGMNRSIPASAIAQLRRAVGDMFPACGDLGDTAALSPWAGFRPATPGGLPIIGASPVKNLYLNVGHGALGWTLACGSAALLADQVAGRKTAIDATAFRL